MPYELGSYNGFKITLDDHRFEVEFGDDDDSSSERFASWDEATDAIDRHQKVKAKAEKAKPLDLPALLAGTPDKIVGVHTGTGRVLFGSKTTVDRYGRSEVHPDTAWTRRATTFLKRLNIVRQTIVDALDDVTIESTRNDEGSSYRSRIDDVAAANTALTAEHAAMMKAALDIEIPLHGMLNIFPEEAVSGRGDWTDFDSVTVH